MKRSRAENAGRKLARAIKEMAQLMYQENTKSNFFKGLSRGIGSAKWIHVSEGLPPKEGRVKYWVDTLDGPAVATWREYQDGYNWECDMGTVYYWQPIYEPKEN